VNTKAEPHPHLDLPVQDIFIHERFFPATLHNDLAMVRLSQAVPWEQLPQVRPICLPVPHRDWTGRRCKVSGWGSETDELKGQRRARLQEVELPVVEAAACSKALVRAGQLGSQFRLHPGWLCAGGERGRDACHGDGGGPLVCRGKGGRAVLAGLVSWGIGCGQRGLPGVYTNIVSYVNWINETKELL